MVSRIEDRLTAVKKVADVIEIQDTLTELLLYIPASQKERAKAIEGRAWDPQRKCWVYRKTKRTYDALIAEFGDDLIPGSVPPPPLPNHVTQIAAPVDNETLAEIRSLREALLSRTGTSSTPAESHTSLGTSREFEREAQRQQVTDAKREAANWRAQALLAQREAARLREELAQ